MKKFFLLLLFVSMTFLTKAQIQPLSRKPVMRPIEPPHLQEKFTQTWGKTVKVVKNIQGIDYNVYSQKLLNAATKWGDVKAQFALAIVR